MKKANRKLPPRDAEQAFYEIFVEAEAVKISNRLVEILNKEFPDAKDTVITTALENIMADAISQMDKDIQFGYAASFIHNVAIKVFQSGE